MKIKTSEGSCGDLAWPLCFLFAYPQGGGLGGMVTVTVVGARDVAGEQLASHRLPKTTLSLATCSVLILQYLWWTGITIATM